MKKWSKLSKILTLGVTVLMAASIFAGCGDEKKSADSGKSSNVAEDVAAIKKRGVLRVGVKNVTKGFGYQDPATGKFSGLEVDLSEALAKKLGVDVEYTPVTAATRTALLDSGDIDMVAATFTITPERKNSWDFTTPYYTDHVGVLVEKASGLKTLADLKGKVVGVSSGSTSAKALVKAMIDAKIIDGEGFDPKTFDAATWNKGVSFKQYADYPAISTALTSGEVQAFCVDKSILAIYCTDDRTFLKEQFAPQEYGLATKKGSGMSKVAEEAVQGWLKDGTIKKLEAKYGLDK
ncbi:transporter substrate-binding domain-containing protein [Acidaminococcus timonensis]|jgi:aspartate/glutamate/glutamine transport system substrate-binding protein|uniref:transporter substrate-binding domain-containing protein n=1 Tax=Acidaminococcus timonensis TaxID=1871002 RepID=UPI0008DA478D|nr:transporter substrate-binding domain-containing protein [Acidaminococcus timonensis]